MRLAGIQQPPQGQPSLTSSPLPGQQHPRQVPDRRVNGLATVPRKLDVGRKGREGLEADFCTRGRDNTTQPFAHSAEARTLW